MDRKEFLKTLAAGSLAACVDMNGQTRAMADTEDAQATLVAVLGGEPGAMFAKGIEEMGGMSRFVKKGQNVTIKPNMAWDLAPELAGNTNPELIAALVKSCLAAGAAKVTVFDHTCANWRSAYEMSGIEKAAQDAGAEVVSGDDKSYYREIQLPRAKNLKSALVHQAILDCDVWFNVPVLKHHGGARMTIAMKNLMGIVWDRQAFHRNNLQQCIADMCTLIKPATLHIVDAYRVVKSNGPRTASENDVVLAKGLFMSTDIVAVDTAAAKFFKQVENIPIEEVSHIAAGEELGLGTMDLTKLNVKRIKM
ncbi:MAG: DUF362 domain-containing protein [Planctomycetia bacterium]|nr:DUF362 domain-containing protein [Planctomycetia bacterium]